LIIILLRVIFLSPLNTIDVKHTWYADGDPSACYTFITGSIARSATCRYLIYSEADFEIFRPAGATCCIDWDETICRNMQYAILQYAICNMPQYETICRIYVRSTKMRPKWRQLR